MVIMETSVALPSSPQENDGLLHGMRGATAGLMVKSVERLFLDYPQSLGWITSLHKVEGARVRVRAAQAFSNLARKRALPSTS